MTAPVHKIWHHPADGLLLAHAAGSLEEAMALIVATHLSFCARCRRIVAQAEAVGGVRVEEMPPVSLAADALEKTLTRLSQLPQNPPHRAATKTITPPPLRAFLGHDLTEVRWRNIGPHLAFVPLARRGNVTLRLLKGAPGTDTGRHTHRGMEYSLVLTGGYTDTTGSYGPGDFQTAAPDVAHNPVADDDGDCINLSVTTGPLRFDGWIAKIAGKLFGF